MKRKPETQGFPTVGYVRLRQILAVLPIGRTIFLARVKSGMYPKPRKLGPKLNAWKASEIRKLLENHPEFEGAPAPPLPRKRREKAAKKALEVAMFRGAMKKSIRQLVGK